MLYTDALKDLFKIPTPEEMASVERACELYERIHELQSMQPHALIDQFESESFIGNGFKFRYPDFDFGYRG